MNDKTEIDATPTHPYKWAAVAIWTLIIAGFLWCAIIRDGADLRRRAYSEAEENIQWILAVKLWGASRGGVFAPTFENTPNPHLAHVKDRDLRTTDGEKFTLMNPAYGIQQMKELLLARRGAVGRMTSLDPLRPENGPDQWERAALIELQKGTPEISEYTRVDGRPVLRMMRPIVADAACLKCHGRQGWKEGEVGGGVSVSLPVGEGADGWPRERFILAGFLGLIWILGLMGILVGAGRISRAEVRRDRAEKTSREKAELHTALLTSMPAVFYIKDRRSNYITGSRTFADTLGIEVDDF
ncbi:MAG: DUF3365 domain-containing protein, partial [Desulfobacterales bacterium]|nr:DUF3365 domain-containing protein [Desulfobacterales bacterium]